MVHKAQDLGYRAVVFQVSQPFVPIRRWRLILPWEHRYGMNLTRPPRASMRAPHGARNLQNGCALGRSAAVHGLLVTYHARRCIFVISFEGLSS